VVAQPDERHANRTASVLEWYDRHRAYYITTSCSNKVVALSSSIRIRVSRQ